MIRKMSYNYLYISKKAIVYIINHFVLSQNNYFIVKRHHILSIFYLIYEKRTFRLYQVIIFFREHKETIEIPGNIHENR